jgi:hypothetical protein
MKNISNKSSQHPSKTPLIGAVASALMVMSGLASAEVCDRAALDDCYQGCGSQKYADDWACHVRFGDELSYCATTNYVEQCVRDARITNDFCKEDACNNETLCRSDCEWMDAFTCSSY